jgi:hypothetical protein
MYAFFPKTVVRWPPVLFSRYAAVLLLPEYKSNLPAEHPAAIARMSLHR